jgi:hypothetical protein
MILTPYEEEKKELTQGTRRGRGAEETEQDEGIVLGDGNSAGTIGYI